jgi:fluoride exporter
MNPLMASALVGTGGFAGSIARYSLTLFCQRFSVEWPFGTMAANLLGCFIIGLITALSDRTEVVSPATRLLLTTGFCGGFTTMSSMIYETAQMLRSSEYFHASFYLGATVVGSMLAFLMGVMSVRLLIKGTGGLWN